MSIRAIDWVLRYSPAENGTRLVHIVLADYSNERSEAYPAVDSIGRDARLSRRKVQIALRKLEELGLIKDTGQKSRYGTTVYRLLFEGGAESAGGRRMEREGGAESAPNPSKDPSLFGDPPNTPPKRKSAGAADRVWAHYVEVMKPRRKTLDPDERDIINRSLRVGEEEELKTAITRCQQSDWHMKRGRHKDRRGGKHHTIPLILKPRQGKAETWRSRLDFWLERPDTEGGESRPERRYTRKRG